MTLLQATASPQLRRADNNERFVAFAFAAAELVAEVEPGGRITYAAGAFRTRLGQAPETFIGRQVQELLDPADHVMLDSALLLLSERGRLSPLLVRLADPERTRLALAGLVLTTTGHPVRLCLTFAAPPAPLEAAHATSPQALARAAVARLRAGTLSDIGLIEITLGGDGASSGAAIGSALQTIAPDALASEFAPGRFGLLGAAGGATELAAIAVALEAALHAQGIEVAIAPHHLPLTTEGLTPTQAARALRQVLNVFARGGTAGLTEAGLAGGLAGYMSRVAGHAGALRRAIRDRRFELMFQPIVSLSDRKLHHYEALLRPKPIPGCPFDTPQEFVAMVETLGLADELDLAITSLASTAALASAVPIAFNLSGQSVQCAAFRDRLLALLSASPARRAGRLIAEMTETAEVENLAEAAQTAAALRAIGIPFCLDDFGAGSADVRVLRAIPADIVKLDGSYVPDVARGGRERAFVAGMVDIARAAGAEVVAEMIETETDAEALSAVGASYGQGWLFGRPAPLPSDDARPAPVAHAAAARRRGEVKESWG